MTSSTEPRASHPPPGPEPAGVGGAGAVGGAANASIERRSEVELLTALSGVAREMHGSLSLEAVLRIATDAGRTLVGAEEAATSQAVDGDWTKALTVRASDEPRAARLPASHRLPSPVQDGGGPADEVCRSNRPLRLWWTTPGRGDDGFAWLGAPLVGSDGRNLGLIQVGGRRAGGEFTGAEEAVLLQLARMASVAIENARLYETALDIRSQLAWAAHVERVRAAELRAVINAMGEAVLVCDASGGVSLVNPAAETLFAGRPVQSYADLLRRFRRPADRRIDPTNGPIELQLDDRPAVWVELRVYPVPGEERSAAQRGPAGQGGQTGEAPGRIAVMRDISAARQARAQRDAFMGILSHELRTPITTIYAGSKVLARAEALEPDTGRELARDISAEAERLFRLVEDLLVMTRIERGVLQLATEPVLLQRVVTAAIRQEQGHWPSTPIRLSGTVDLPAVAGDATYVEQVVRNLLSNAGRYSPPDATIEVHLEALDGNEVACRVLDRGRGFQGEGQDDLFELFSRSPTTAAQAAGAGIGLFVCRRLVQAMSGRIWARRRSEGGTEFGFALRCYRDTD